MKSIRLTQNKFKKITAPKTPVELPAFLGDLDGVVKADEKSNVYVTLYNGQVEKAKNHTAPLIYKLPVIVGLNASNQFEVLRVRNAYENPPYLHIPNHAEKNHSEFGVDPARVTKGQILDGLAFPLPASMIVQFYAVEYYLNGYHKLDNQQIDFTDDIPESGAVVALVEVDEAGSLSKRFSAIKESRAHLAYEDIPAPASNKKSLFAVMLYQGQTQITKNKSQSDILDLRFAGISSGGIATAIAWDDVLDKPAVFPPDLDITDAVYPRKYIWNAAPTVDDDVSAGYMQGDLWVDETNAQVYVCINNTDGAAVWLNVSGGGKSDYEFIVDGALAVVASAANAMLVLRDVEIEEWYIFCKNTGTENSTIVDINKNGVTIFATQANRPTLAYNDANGWAVSGLPEVTSFALGDLITIDIDAIATGAADLLIVGKIKSSGGGDGAGLIVEQSGGSPSASNVGKIVFDGMEVTDDTGGQVTVSKKRDYILLKDEKPSGTAGGNGSNDTWNKRTVTEFVDTGNHCSVTSSVITLAMGTYECLITVPGYACATHKARLRDTTNNTTLLVGTSEFSRQVSGVYYSQSSSIIRGVFTLSGETTLEIQHYYNTGGTNAYGSPTASGEVEIYVVAEFWRVA